MRIPKDHKVLKDLEIRHPLHLALAALAKVVFFEGLRDQWINFKVVLTENGAYPPGNKVHMKRKIIASKVPAGTVGDMFFFQEMKTYKYDILGLF